MDDQRVKEAQAKYQRIKAAENLRCLQCPFRTEKWSCGIADLMLGFTWNLPLEDCDQCYEKGTASTEEGLAFLSSKVEEILQNLMNQDLAKLPRSILIPLTQYHMDPVALKERSEEVQRAYQSLGLRVNASTMFQKASSFLKAVSSGKLDPSSKADRKTYERRHISCFGTTPDGDYVQPPCPSLLKTDKGMFCGACGCGTRKHARLDLQTEDGTSKLHYRELSCPLGRPGFTKPKYINLTVHETQETSQSILGL